MKILVVEDDDVQQTLLQAMFGKIGVDALFVHTGEAGLEKLRTHFFDAMLLDLNLPGKSGVQILRMIRENVMISDMPVVIFTGDKTRETLAQCMQIGITDYIAKPVDMHQFGVKFARLRKIVAQMAATRGKADTVKINFERSGGVLRISFGGLLNEEAVKRFDAQYTPGFKSITKPDKILLSLAALPGLNEAQVRCFNLILALIEPKKPLIVAGRSFGPLLDVLPDYEERLFMTEADALKMAER